MIYLGSFFPLFSRATMEFHHMELVRLTYKRQKENETITERLSGGIHNLQGVFGKFSNLWG